MRNAGNFIDVRIERLAKAPKEPQDTSKPRTVRADDGQLPDTQVSETEESRRSLSFIARVAIVLGILAVTLGFSLLIRYGRRKKVQ